ncbi:hypothetical protein LPW11_10420 [Geomonas sp. RF6]|uniref:protealysin inhibitor emfourin n=1 Tax=Geomonas sp. RF6 TaxID=2897342 RepID=UPI001E353D32|nr:protealysin inhibitor emfourin [Geomonas sp. RF6]UFS72589.1 hypothetical protein LPW11_10420 [Geomonas sp. RF6]
MQIFFEQSGGFGGLRFHVAVETEKLPAEEADRVKGLLAEADFFHLPGRIVSPRPQPDRYQYFLKVEGEGKCHEVTVSEEAVPEHLAPLIKWLQGEMRRRREGAR